MNNQQFKFWCENYFTSENRVSQALVMGIVNVTPDSFSDGGQYNELPKALAHALRLVDEGADIIDVGGESVRPGAMPVSEQEELDRVIPFIERLRQESDICISIDTTKPAVMKEAINAGAGLINDISALQEDKALSVAASTDCAICLMHMQGTPNTMQDNPHYGDVIDEINEFLKQRIEACVAAGIKRERLIVDPGFGFGKKVEHNLQLTNQLSRFSIHQRPILLGVSRKTTIGKVLNKNIDERLIGGLVLTTIAMEQGLGIIRTHDVADTKQVVTMMQAVNKSWSDTNKMGA
ncbi:7,8-dihydropteroate synthase [Legionella birminghamensis]|uniref:Dihydropteroate synthase n=1 Tax=Legionella birminghamensis TaxID=28083 RepID=A0A378I6U0_9GAMM|nr:7,8-dihydropteroate synthase [Legionella birminghamensis]STX30572.1 dihydropteroate synthase [Legionella birminghamensis]